MVIMIFCSKCGEELLEGSKFCTKCGTAVNLEAKAETVVQSFEKDPLLRDHWIRRVIAFVIDNVIVAVGIAFVALILMLPFSLANLSSVFSLLNFPFILGMINILYFAFAESYRGSTIGKGLMDLKVVTKSSGNPSFEKAFIRNVSKIHPVLLLLDLVAGLITSTDLHQKYSDRIANTSVV
jgi:uncharacterized RDD family membrane protein YckC